MRAIRIDGLRRPPLRSRRRRIRGATSRFAGAALVVATAVAGALSAAPTARAQVLFQWFHDGRPDDPSLVCVRVNEPAEPRREHWDDNYLCSDVDLGLRWSHAGPIDRMRCTRIREPSEPRRDHWDDNFLCLPWASPLELTWSADGPIEGKNCVLVNEPSDHDRWGDNYLCHTLRPQVLFGDITATYPKSEVQDPNLVSRGANVCVSDVPGSLYRLDRGGGDSSLFSFRTAGLVEFTRRHHAQGIVRLPGAERENWLAVSKSGEIGIAFVRFELIDSDGSAWAEVADRAHGWDQGRVEYVVDHENPHVGGMQALGKMLVVGSNDGSVRVDFYDVSRPETYDPADPATGPRLLNTLVVPWAHYVAAARLGTGRYLLFTAGDGRRVSTHIRMGWFYVSDRDEISSATAWTEVSSVPLPERKLGRQSASLLVECETGEVYLAGMRPDRIRSNFLDLWRVEPTGSELRLVRIDELEVKNTLDGCSFDAGASIHVTPDHRPVLYCVEKVQDFGGSRPANLDLEEFRDRDR
jgi:hypothetical protein